MTDEQWAQLAPYAEAFRRAAEDFAMQQTRNVAGPGSRERMESSLAAKKLEIQAHEARNAYHDAQRRILGAVFDY